MTAIPERTRRLGLEPLEARAVPVTGLSALKVNPLGGFIPAQTASPGTPATGVNAASSPGNHAVTAPAPTGGYTTAPVSVSQSGGILYIYGTGGSDNVRVTESNGSTTVEANGQSYGGYQNVTDLRFFGGAGDDRFVNDTGFISHAFGDGGNDTLVGGGNYDYLVGGTNHDRLLGRGGNDTLEGLGGFDTLNGGAGMDYLYGGADDDVLVTIDGGTTDYADGGGGNDAAWLDQVSVWNGWWWQPTWDTCYVEKAQNVTGFANGADRSLDGDRIADPTDGGTYRRFDNNPLFGRNGPVLGDVRQGNLGNCWLMASAAAIANDNPTAVRQNVVDFGDGTYGVKIAGNFYRVDNDLPVLARTGSMRFAALGHDGGMWVAILEKAYAAYRNGSNTYGSLANGSGHALYGNDGYGVAWSTSYASAPAFADEIWARWNNYECVGLAFQHDAGDAVYLPNTDLVNGHVFTVVSVSRNSAGTVTGITLRNPWGKDVLSGTARDGNNDGFIDLTPAQLFVWTSAIVYGKV